MLTDPFIRSLLDALPVGVLVMDASGRVQAVNDVVERAFGAGGRALVDGLTGDTLNCVSSYTSRGACGGGAQCSTCVIRRTARTALGGSRTPRVETAIHYVHEGMVTRMVVLVSASPMEYQGQRHAVLVLEDVSDLERHRVHTPGAQAAEHCCRGIIGATPPMRELSSTIRDLAEVNVSVLIQGESGTGKELVAQAIHHESTVRKGAFVAVNCAALPDGLLESELFGHVKGAFTGAIRDKKGRFELAHGGTLFLDEVADLSSAMQVKLLRVLQERKFERVGGEQTVTVDVRLVCATNKSLAREVAEKRFREDLFYRICVVPVTVPPLRARLDDLPLLVSHFLEIAARESGARPCPGVADESMRRMRAYQWPGNVRELQNCVQYALVRSRGGIIMPEHLPPQVGGAAELRPLMTPRQKLDEATVRDALMQADGNKVVAARILKVSRATLYRFFVDHPHLGG